MSREERELRAWLDGVNAQFSKPVIIDNDQAAAYLSEQDQIKRNNNIYEAKKAAETRKLDEIRKGTYKEPIFDTSNIDEAAEMLTHINKQIKARIRADKAYLTLPKKAREGYDHLEELHDIDFKQLMEAKAERTKAELLEDFETVEELNKDIKSIEERLSFYSEQMKAIAGGEDGTG